jgi:hypothetical protein
MTTTSHRLVLEGVPRVGFFEGGPACPEDIPFPSVIRALMEYFDETDFGCRSRYPLKPGCKVTCSYAFYIGVSGVAAFLSWKPGWEGDNMEIMYMSDDPAAPFEHAFQAAGYGHQVVGMEAGRDNEALFRRTIVESIQEGRPVLAFGPSGPPEAAIITGYDEGGGDFLTTSCPCRSGESRAPGATSSPLPFPPGSAPPPGRSAGRCGPRSSCRRGWGSPRSSTLAPRA